MVREALDDSGRRRRTGPQEVPPTHAGLIPAKTPEGRGVHGCTATIRTPRVGRKTVVDPMFAPEREPSRPVQPQTGRRKPAQQSPSPRGVAPWVRQGPRELGSPNGARQAWGSWDWGHGNRDNRFAPIRQQDLRSARTQGGARPRRACPGLVRRVLPGHGSTASPALERSGIARPPGTVG